MSQSVLQMNVVRAFGQPEEASEPIRELTVARPQLKVVPAADAARPRSLRLFATMTTPLGLAVAISVLIVSLVLGPLGGLRYYSKSPDARAADSAHSVLRPSGSVGRTLGIAGTVLMLLMQLYSIRKRASSLTFLGPVSRWLDLHVMAGILGPLAITLHTSFKFNGIVAVAYWSMVLVMLSGFVGRYLFARIPKSLRGQELTHDELLARADELKAEMLDVSYPEDLLRRVEAFESRVIPAAESAVTLADLVVGDVKLRYHLFVLSSELAAAGVSGHLLDDAARLAAERATLLRRIAYLRKTKQLFEVWHVLHRPLAIIMAVVVVLHVGTALYLGYAFGAR